jgi:hypothetical protein
MDNFSINQIFQFLISFITTFFSYLRFKFKYERNTKSQTPVKIDPISKIKDEQIFTLEDDKYNFSAAGNCNDFVDNFNPYGNKLILKQGGREN